MNQGFAELSSPIHDTAPTVRVFTAFTLSVVTALAGSPLVPAVSLCIGLLLVAVARIPLGMAVKRLLPLTFFLLLIWLVLPFTGTGVPLEYMAFGPLVARADGISLALLISLKSYGIVLILMALVSTMHPFAMGQALGHLGMPEKLTFLLVMSARYISVFEKEYKKLWNAAKIRGFQPDTSLHTYRTVAYLVGMLLVRSHLRAGRVYKAMVLRGFDGQFRMLTNQPTQRLSGCVPQAVAMGLLVVGLTSLFAYQCLSGDVWLTS